MPELEVDLILKDLFLLTKEQISVQIVTFEVHHILEKMYALEMRVKSKIQLYTQTPMLLIFHMLVTAL